VQVLPDIDPLVERYLERIVGIDVRRQSIDAVFLLRLETSKPPVPNDQYPGMIAVNILRIGRVVDAVMRRCVSTDSNTPIPLISSV
jgi:hypothetical protein